MSILAADIQTSYQSLIAPNDNTRFYELLTEADERLLRMGRWRWVRASLTRPVEDDAITLPDAYEAIVGARINGIGVGVGWEESEWFEGGPGERIPIEGAKTMLVDMGLIDDVRTYKLTSISDEITEVEVLARYKPALIDAGEGELRCPNKAALKHMLLAIVHENSTDTSSAENYRNMARRELDEQEAAYRGVAKQVYKPSLTQPLRRRSRQSFP